MRLQPLSDNAREKTASAFSDALKSVFVSTIKLAAFHALFTWLTFRYGCHLHQCAVQAEKSASVHVQPAGSGVSCPLPIAEECADAIWSLCRMFGIHLIYLSVLASAIAACLPLVPVCLVAVPAALQLLAQVCDADLCHCSLRICTCIISKMLRDELGVSSLSLFTCRVEASQPPCCPYCTCWRTTWVTPSSWQR